jgi:WD40 repeat protein
VWDEESGVLHRELDDFEGYTIDAVASFLSADGQQPRLAAGSGRGHLKVYDPEAGSIVHTLRGHLAAIHSLACVASSSAAPHHPRIVSTSSDLSAKVWDGETGAMLADLRGHAGPVRSVAVWKEHTGGHDRIATAGYDGRATVWGGKAFTLLHELGGWHAIKKISAFRSAEGPARLLVARREDHGLQIYDPEEGRLLHDGIGRGWESGDCHLLESAQGRHLLAAVGTGTQSGRNPHGTVGTRLDVWDLGEAPAAERHMRPAHKHG